MSNFVKKENEKEVAAKDGAADAKKLSHVMTNTGNYQSSVNHSHQMWHSRSYDSGMGNYKRTYYT